MKPEYIILHCSDSEFGSSRVIDKWHKERGFDGVGYHFVICNGNEGKNIYLLSKDGAIENGREIGKDGAHCLGYNHNSIGICLIGINNFTESQLDSARALINELCDLYSIPNENVLGHYETPASHGKTCPNIDMDWFRGTL